MQQPKAPTQHHLTLRGNYARAEPDYTVQQDWDRYDLEDHDIWRTLYGRQIRLVERYAAPEFLGGFEMLEVNDRQIPRFTEVNRTLQQATGWRIVAVPGLIPEKAFFAHLANRSFPVSVWIRGRHELDYLSEPDLFHDFFGHVPLLTNPVFGNFMQAYGAAGPKAAAHGAVHMLARLYWYTVEFGLLNASAGLKAYGAGILSSKEETVYSIESPVPHRIGFDLTRAMRTHYLIDELQKTYFVLDSFEQLFHAAYDTDFASLYDRYAQAPGLSPEILLPNDRSFISAH